MRAFYDPGLYTRRVAWQKHGEGVTVGGVCVGNGDQGWEETVGRGQTNFRICHLGAMGAFKG